MKKLFTVLTICLITLSACSQKKNTVGIKHTPIIKEETNYQTIELKDLSNSYISNDNDSFKEATNTYTDFALNIYKECYKDNSENSLLSPYSLYSALSILANGTNNNTAKLMESFLGMSVEDLNNYNKDILDHSTLNSANGLWFNNANNLTLKDSFKSTISQYYGSDAIKETSFANKENVVNEVNDWAYHKSNNTIDNILSNNDVNESDSFLLLNALAIDEYWQLPFDSNETYSQEFHNLDGSTGNATMMHQTIDGYWHTNDAQGFMKPAGQYYLVGILPNEGVDYETFINNLDSTYINNFINSEIKDENYDPNTNTADLHRTVLSFPKFSNTNEYDLTNHLKKLGLNEIFTSADFTNMADGDEDTISKIFLSTVKQKNNVEINEEKVKMSSVTLVKADLGAAGPKFNYIDHEVTFDRPFIYLLVKNNRFAEGISMISTNQEDYAHLPLFIGSISYLNDSNVTEKKQDDCLGNVTIKADAIKVRQEPSLSGKHLSSVKKGQSMKVYDIKSNEGYTWYMINQDEWIADDGSWLEYNKM